MKEVLFGVVVPWVTMLPFVLVAIATIEMIKEWLPSRLPDDGPPTEMMPIAGTLDPQACRAESTRLDY